MPTLGGSKARRDAEFTGYVAGRMAAWRRVAYLLCQEWARADDLVQGAAQLAGDGLTVAASRPVGTVHLLDGLWQELGVDVALRKVLGPCRFTTDVERVLFALAANRAIDPMPKLSAAEWASNDVAIGGLEAMDEDQAYRAMDLLVEADAQAEV